MARKSLLGIALAFAAVTFLSTSPAAQEGGRGAVVLILDASGSMNRVDSRGVVLIDGAKDALRRLVDSVPEGAEVGLVVYGHRVGDDDPSACTDIEVVVPVGPIDRSAMTRAIADITARGETPIGSALDAAAAALPDGAGTVILVSDGEDTCAPPDPCDVAADLIDAGVDVRVHTVGFFLDDDGRAQQQLGCIADATGGTYRSVGEVDALVGELGVLVSEALPEEMGQFVVPLDGALSMAAAPTLPMAPTTGSTGQIDAFQASVGGEIAPGETRWYRVDVDGPVLLLASGNYDGFVPDAAAGESLRIVVTDEDGTEINFGPSRWGLPEIDLGTVDPTVAFFGTSAGSSGFDIGWDVMEARQFVEYLGFDADSYDAAVREVLTRPAPEPLEDGTYLVGVTWDAAPERPSRELPVLVGLIPSNDAKHLTYVEVEGGLDPSEAVEVEPPQFDPFHLPAPVPDIALRGGYVGPIEAGETRWYEVPPVPEGSVAVRGLLNRPEGSADEGEFAVGLHGGAGDLSEPRDDLPLRLPLDDLDLLDDFELPPGLEPRPLVGAKAPGSELPVLISFTWDGPPGERGAVEFVVDVDGEFAEPSSTADPVDTEPMIVDGSEADDGAGRPGDEISGEGDGPDSASSLGVLVFAAVGLAGIVTVVLAARGRRSRGSVDRSPTG